MGKTYHQVQWDSFQVSENSITFKYLDGKEWGTLELTHPSSTFSILFYRPIWVGLNCFDDSFTWCHFQHPGTDTDLLDLLKKARLTYKPIGKMEVFPHLMNQYAASIYLYFEPKDAFDTICDLGETP